MAKEKNVKETAVEQGIDVAASKGEQFYTRYKKVIWGVLVALVAAGLLVLVYVKFYYQPKCIEGQNQMALAEEAFMRGDYETALNGEEGNFAGFEQIADEYGCKAGKSVYFYAGVCALRLEKYQDALDYLSKYNVKDPILSACAKACEGDAYVGLGEENYSKAADCYMKAAKMADNVFAAGHLLKAGVVYEALGKKDEALKCYESIKTDYPESIEAYEIDKYIARIQAAE